MSGCDKGKKYVCVNVYDPKSYLVRLDNYYLVYFVSSIARLVLILAGCHPNFDTPEHFIICWHSSLRAPLAANESYGLAVPVPHQVERYASR